MIFSKKHLFLLLVVFLISVLVRIPTLNRPLSKHHEFCTAIALRVLQIWNEARISTYQFNPVMTYPKLADKFINNHASGSGEMKDAEGNYYYTSHPPLAYYVPFFALKIFGIRPDVLPLQLFNILIHFLCGIGIYAVLLQLMPPDAKSQLVAPFAGYVAYMFSPGTLWFHSNVYMADILVQLFFIYGVYCALRFSEKKKKKWISLLAFASFLMTYTSWLGVFFCATTVAWFVRKKDWKHALLVGVCCAAALLLTIIQYCQIAGWDALRHEWLGRFSERSGWNSWIAIGGMLMILKNYLTSYLPLIAAILFLLNIFIKQFKRMLDGALILFFFFSSIPVVLLHVILSNYSGHDFTSLYGGLLLSVVFGVLIHLASEKTKPSWIVAGMIVFIYMSIAQFYYINRPGESSLNGDRYADFQDIGKSIAGQSSNDEVIFLIGMKPSPEIIFYAGRNIRQVSDENEATDFLEQHNKIKGVIFEVKEKNEVTLLDRINLDKPQ